MADGGQPSLRVVAATEWTRTAADDAAPDVELIDASPGVARPRGPRFGVLVHAALAIVPLDATAAQIEDAVTVQARILAASIDEIEAARAAVTAALGHPLMERARRASGVRRETPLTSREADGALVEGVLDLAFEEADGWTVVDFKTDVEMEGAIGRYRRQVALYASVVARATGRAAKAVLMRV